MKTHMEHVIDLPADEYFDKIYFNEAFNDALFKTLNFRERTVTVQREQSGGLYREVRQVPERDLPGPVKKVLGSSELAYVEKSTYYKDRMRAEIEVVSSVMTDKVKCRGAFWVEPMGDKRCRRVLDMEVKVSVFGVGGMIEKLIIKDLEDSYGKSADYTNRWVREGKV